MRQWPPAGCTCLPDCLPACLIHLPAPHLQEVDEVVAVLDSGKAPHVTRVMLDNMSKKDPAAPGGVDVSLLKQAVARLGGRIKTEASGNVTVESVPAIAATGVTYISCGSLTHSVKALDISLNIETQ
jgi:nicotinate-nucleotide pyrophosphorylase (carboxylating)